ncbi:hypothetical protein [Methylorubrum suomiense]|uniref:Uncharacterized protein n=1 Tax=Methylorubrum suomiense TaxID=144191 RepID=A0ABQ4UZH1_9HYPH|nr:hypothetical protein [Methylorubrum suomiense]GJE77284.1 hypothetical protein BGCPKDLD_3887 [Methylorubrum suomiense]
MHRVLSIACAALALGLLTANTADARGRGGGGRGGFCNYCGCKGGPGYRAPDGKCVGKRNITKVCGSPPSTRCKFEGKSGEINQTPNPSHHPKMLNPFAVQG